MPSQMLQTQLFYIFPFFIFLMIKKIDSLVGFPTLSKTVELIHCVEQMGMTVDSDVMKFVSGLFNRYFTYSYVYPCILNDVRGVWVTINKQQRSAFDFPQILVMLSIVIDATELHQRIIERVRDGSLNDDLDAPDEIYYFYRINEWVEANKQNNIEKKSRIESHYNIIALRNVITFMLDTIGICVNARF